MFSGAGSLKGLKAGFGANLSIDEANASGSGTGFKLGGRVKKTEKALIHKNEYVLPVGVKPTEEQKKQVRELRKKSKDTK